MRMSVVRRISHALMMLALLGAFCNSKAQEKTSPPPPVDKDMPAPTKVVPPKPDEGTAATIIDARSIESVLGKDVLNAAGENLGRIVDVLVDRSGHVRAAVIDFGGFLGVGSRKIAIDWTALRFEPKGSSSIIRFDLAREQLRVAPEVRPGEPVVIIGAARPANPSAKVK
jgi:sporulation protein YlmC with PRC-barrel domain